jgi:hypothetical protein
MSCRETCGPGEAGRGGTELEKRWIWLNLQAWRVVDRPPATKLAAKLLSGLCESPQIAKLSPRTASGTIGQATKTGHSVGFCRC